MEALANSPRPSWLVPPVWLALALLAMVLLEEKVPGPRWLPPPAAYGGWVVLAVGLAIAAWSLGLFARRKTGIRPFTPVTTLVTDGPYRFTRNPMYLSMVLVLAGVALLQGATTPWLVLPAFIWLISTRFIRREEGMLEGLYGETYKAYCRRVRRWI